MAQYDKVAFIPLNHFLLLIAVVFAVAATLLTILISAAATETGESPATAITLIDGENTGILGAGKQRWFRLVPDTQDQAQLIERSLTLAFSPNHHESNSLVSLKIFDEDQVQFFDSEDTTLMTPLDVGQFVAAENSETEKLIWTGSILAGRIYYIQILNGRDFPLDYWLVNHRIGSRPLGAENEIDTSVTVPLVDVGASPSNATTLESGVNQGRLKPHATHWYTFVQNDLSNSDHFQDQNYSLFFTPDDGNRRQHVNFELFTASEIETWYRGEHDQLRNFGAGRLVSRDGDFNTGERVWGGTLLRGDTYFLAVENGADVEIDYWLFDEDVYNPELGPKPELAPAPVFAAGAAPHTARALNFGQNLGGLDPGEEVWYSFAINDHDGEFFEEMALTMIVTPDDGNRIHSVTFDVFTAEGVRNWSPGDNSQINNVGAGSLVIRDNNPLTGERFWTGWVVENNLYYVQIRNGSDMHIDYWLFTDDVYGPELGQ